MRVRLFYDSKWVSTFSVKDSDSIMKCAAALKGITCRPQTIAYVGDMYFIYDGSTWDRVCYMDDMLTVNRENGESCTLYSIAVEAESKFRHNM